MPRPQMISDCRPKISVVVPVFNAEETIEEAIESLLQQELQDFELIVVNDGSTDQTGQVVDRLAGRDRRVRLICEPRRGIAETLNRGVEEAKGSYVARMDADDSSLPQRLRLQSGFLDRNRHIGLVASRVIFGGEHDSNRGYASYVQWSNSVLDTKEIALQRFVEAPIVHPSVMFRRELVDQFGGYQPGDFPEDYELWLRWLDKGVLMQKLPEPLLIWNDGSSRLSRTDPRYERERFFEIKAPYLARWLESNNPFHPAIWLIGAGRTARRRAQKLEEAGIEIAAYVDIDPKKVGRAIQGRPVIHRKDLPPPGVCFLLSYVGSRGARREIRQFVEECGYRMGNDFLLAA